MGHGIIISLLVPAIEIRTLERRSPCKMRNWHILALLTTLTYGTWGQAWGQEPPSRSQQAMPPSASMHDNDAPAAPVRGDMAATITGYDCHHEDTLFSAVSLQSPAKCPDIESNYDKPVRQDFQILQTMEALPLGRSYRCQLRVSKVVNRCSDIGSKIYGTHFPLWNQVIKISEKDCKEAYRRRTLTYEGKKMTFDLGEPVQFSYWSHGHVDTDGYCYWKDKFFSEGVIYTWSVQQVMASLLVEDVSGTYDVLEDKVTFPTLGLSGNYAPRMMQDWEAGTLIWEKPSAEDCSKTVSEVYRGPAWVHKRSAQMGEYQDAIILINSTSTNQYAGLVIKELNRPCGHICYRTHIPQLSICPWTTESDEMGNGKRDDLFNPSADTARVNIQTQLGHMHFGTHLEVSEAFRQVSQTLCELDRKILGNKLQAIAGESTPYALMDLYGPGYTSYIAGAVAYIAKCVPVQLARAEYANCTHEIPVKYNGNPMFMNPITRIIQRHPTELPCSDVMQVRWQLTGDKWFCAGPQIRNCESPLLLEPLAPKKMDVDFTTGMGRGIYTDDQLRAHQRFDNSRTSRVPIVARIASQAADRADAVNGPLGTILGGHDLSEIQEQLTPVWFPMLWSLGTAWHYLTGLGFLYIICKILFGFCVRVYGLYSRRGWGLWLLGAITDTTFMIAAFPVSVVKSLFDINQDPYRRRDRREAEEEEERNRGKGGRGGDDQDDDPPSDAGGNNGPRGAESVVRRNIFKRPATPAAERGEVEGEEGEALFRSGISPRVSYQTGASPKTSQKAAQMLGLDPYATQGSRMDSHATLDRKKKSRESSSTYPTHMLLGERVRAAQEELRSTQDRVTTELQAVARRLTAGRATSIMNLSGTDQPPQYDETSASAPSPSDDPDSPTA